MLYLPSILPDIKNLLTEYITCPERLPIHDYKRNQEFWPRKPNLRELFVIENMECGTTLKVHRDSITGKILEFREVSIGETGTAKNSMSLKRNPTLNTDGIRGNPLNMPFWPGGFPKSIITIPNETVDFTQLLTVPPGFKKGLNFSEDGKTVLTDETVVNRSTTVKTVNDSVNLLSVIQEEQELLGNIWKESKVKYTKEGVLNDIQMDESQVLPKEVEIPILNISKANERIYNKSTLVWCEEIDVRQPLNDFYDRMPDMAREFEFELDNFQKHAILKLEENRDVLVVAHTSAGKTVVAEYAIALSQKHNTRSIYTSPIKALSNQKYRDFKKIFKDVGLVTGDHQINQTGTCLIMTTEILRSMLYCGSEVIRDLEYVIFDEVHYVNDVERGYVWEEVLILLPKYVRVILLSATVSNPDKFGNWLGMIRESKVYIIKTPQRPVPLEHYIFAKSPEPHIILNAKGQFQQAKYEEIAASDTVVKQRLQTQKTKLKQEQTELRKLITTLKRKDLLPVVAFTFSRAKCDFLANMLADEELTNKTEKHNIHTFYQKCLKQLKEQDQQLPQVMMMQQLLKNGIGVHHSGILPILKEIVEMLFQKGLVKILFATETFSMGINMPARTVVFNGIKKWDGKELRYLNATEYVQMAGRAGRRGLDTTGTVIIRITHDFPSTIDLKTMMLGKVQSLQSQFRLTYSMLLSLLRTEVFDVKSMMSRSFHEVPHLTKSNQLKIVLSRLQKEYAEESSKELGEHLMSLNKFYDAAAKFIEEWEIIQPQLLNQPYVSKQMSPGRVLLISHREHFKKLAVLLSPETTWKKMRVLVLSNEINQEKQETHPEIWYRMLSFTQEQIFQPEKIGGHEVLQISLGDVEKISTKLIKVDCDLVLKDWEKRQIPRFKDDPPGQNCQKAIQELTKLTNNVLSGSVVQYLDPVKDYKIGNIDLLKDLDYLKLKWARLEAQINLTKIANFEQQFNMIFKRKYLKGEIDKVTQQISFQSLSLYPDYDSRIHVLKETKFIDEENKVLLKGRVARLMGMQELLITDILVKNVFNNLKAAEIAALLSSIVYQGKNKSKQQNNESNKVNEENDSYISVEYELAKEEMIAIYRNITSIEMKYRVSYLQTDPNFDLEMFVYKWANGMPFAKIMEETELPEQEGIIVRCIQQLNDILKNVKDAARIIGSAQLELLMDETMNNIKRDIVFSASLYT